MDSYLITILKLCKINKFIPKNNSGVFSYTTITKLNL
nr:MAG TPA: hypothetical protein [Caudoviricetes sp.]